jgi:hypothetical protein
VFCEEAGKLARSGEVKVLMKYDSKIFEPFLILCKR